MERTAVVCRVNNQPQTNVMGRLLQSEFEHLFLPESITEYSTMENTILQNAVDSKAKDFVRGIHVNAVCLGLTSLAMQVLIS